MELISHSSESFRFLEWGITPYEDALNKQLTLVQDVYDKKFPNTIIFCSHEPIVTKGRGTLDSDIFGWKGLTLEVQRGGRATYHGPNQLIVYPIVNLQRGTKMIGIREYTNLLESIVVSVLADYKVIAEGRCGYKVDNQEATGVWIGNRKICSLGIGVKRWVTYHGIALNLDHDPKAFQGLNPCGFSASTMVSLEELIGKRVPQKEIIEKFKFYFEKSNLL